MAALRVGLAALLGVAAADVHVARTIEHIDSASSVTVTVDGPSCSSVDPFGSDDCDFDWGTSYTAHVNATLGKDIVSGSKIDVDAKIDRLVPFKVTCDACGAPCTVTVPVIKKTFTIDMPDCPISATTVQKTMQVALPAKSPIPLIKISVKGEVTVTDPSGGVLAKLSVDASLAPKEQDTLDTTDGN